MANQNSFKKIDPSKASVQDTHAHDMNIIKPFIKFGFNALGLIAKTLILIVKSIPKPNPDKPVNNTDKKIIKI